MPQTAIGSEPHSSTTRAVIEQVLRTWATPRVNETVEWFGEDATYILHLDLQNAGVPAGGEIQGLSQIRNTLMKLRTSGEFLLFAPIIRDVTDRMARVHARFEYLDRPSGNVLASTLRMVVTVAHRRVLQLEEFHDAPRVEAFFRYVAWKPQR